MKTIFQKVVQAIRLAQGDVGVWIGEVTESGLVVAERVPLDRAMRTHFSLGFHSDRRWRFVENADTVFWWHLADISAADKQAVEQWLAARGLFVRKHAGNTQEIRVAGKKMLGLTFSHGSGPRARWKMRVDKIVTENKGPYAFT